MLTNTVFQRACILMRHSNAWQCCLLQSSWFTQGDLCSLWTPVSCLPKKESTLLVYSESRRQMSDHWVSNIITNGWEETSCIFIILMIEYEDIFSLWIDYFSASPTSECFTLWSAEKMQLAESALGRISLTAFWSIKVECVSSYYLWVTWLSYLLFCYVTVYWSNVGTEEIVMT